jgi:hypothetical protein
MIFTRTTRGINNLHRFYNVDFIVFLEGGATSYNKEEVYAGKYSDETEDIIFWKRVFTIFVPDRKLKFKSIGSKRTLKQISDDIIDGTLTSIILTMDNEFDEVLNKRIIHRQIYYTHGYSWENDVWSPIVVKRIIKEITAIDIENDILDLKFNDFLKDIETAVSADCFLFSQDSSFFPRRSNHLFCINCTPGHLPEVLLKPIDDKMNSLELDVSDIRAFGRSMSLTPQKFCYGHLLADYCCQLIIRYIKSQHQLTAPSKSIIYRMALNKYFDFHFESSTSYEWYKQQVARNIA